MAARRPGSASSGSRSARCSSFWRRAPGALGRALVRKPRCRSGCKPIDTFTAGKSFGFGALLSGVNPKNLALTIAAATTIAQTGISGGEAAGALAVFILVGSLSILAPVVIYFVMGAKAAVILDELKTWMAAHNAAIMSVLLLVLGAKLIGDAIAGLS